MASLQEIQAKLPDKDAFWVQMTRSGWYLPSQTSSIISIDYLNDVLEGEIWVPKFDEVHIRPCVLPPPKEEFAREILSHLAGIEEEIEIGITTAAEHYKFNREWLQNVLSTLNPDHQFFQKGFR